MVSLGNDQLGYLLPDFDFVLDRRNPYIDQAPGEYYEETVAVGVDGWSRIGGSSSSYSPGLLDEPVKRTTPAAAGERR